MSSNKSKSISLTFRGISADPSLVEELMEVKASLLGRAGLPVRPGVRSILKRSVAQFSMCFSARSRLDEMIPSLLTHLGGINHIVMVRDRILPEFFELDFVLPIKNSEEQESGFITKETISDLHELGCSVSFQFL